MALRLVCNLGAVLFSPITFCMEVGGVTCRRQKPHVSNIKLNMKNYIYVG